MVTSLQRPLAKFELPPRISNKFCLNILCHSCIIKLRLILGRAGGRGGGRGRDAGHDISGPLSHHNLVAYALMIIKSGTVVELDVFHTVVTEIYIIT